MDDLGADRLPRLGRRGDAAARPAHFALWGVVEARSRAPMADLRMLAHRPVLLTNVATLISGFALFSCFVLVPTFVESSAGYGFGASATGAGLFLLPSSIAMLFAGPLAGAAGRRYGSKWPLATGMLVVSAAALVFAAAHDEPWHVYAASALLGVGVGVGAAFAAMAALIAENVHATEMGVASGMNTVVRVAGSVVGGQVGAALLTAQTIGRSSVPAESAFTLSAVAALVAARRSAPVGRRRVLLAGDAGSTTRAADFAPAADAERVPPRAGSGHEHADPHADRDRAPRRRPSRAARRRLRRAR